MYCNFTKKQTEKKNKGWRPDSLVIDHDVIEYVFTKRKPKSIDEMRNDVYAGKGFSLKPISTIVSVYIDAKTIKYINYDPTTNDMMIAGHFSICYRNSHGHEDVIYTYDNDVYCITFKYKFLTPEIFVDEVKKRCGDIDVIPQMIPLSL